jgi:hypothetical protein
MVGLITVNVNVVRGMITVFRATLRTEPVTALYETSRYCALTVNQIRYSCRVPLLSARPAAIMVRGCIVVAADSCCAVHRPDHIGRARVPLV